MCGPQRNRRWTANGSQVPPGDDPPENARPTGAPSVFLQQPGRNRLPLTCREVAFAITHLLPDPIWHVLQKILPPSRDHRNSTPQTRIQRKQWSHAVTRAEYGVHTLKGKPGLVGQRPREERPARRSSTSPRKQGRRQPVPREQASPSATVLLLSIVQFAGVSYDPLAEA